VTSRIVASFLAVLAAVLVAVVIPLGLIVTAQQARDFTDQVDRVALTVGALAEEHLDDRAPVSVLKRVLDRLADDGYRIAVLDSRGEVVAHAGLTIPAATLQAAAAGAQIPRTDVPIIIVSARGEEVDRVIGLELGADDYIVKPFGFAELTARMRAVLRRVNTGGVVSYGRLRLDVPARRAYVDDAPVALTGKEFDILACLAVEPGRAVTREEIFDRVWDEHWYSPRKVLDVHIAALRRKLGDPALIETVYGRGFRLAQPGQP
jgi:DNA-binding response OmpR family regulator